MSSRIDIGVFNDRLWTLDNVAEFCQVKTSVVQYWLKNTDIPYIKIGKKVRFDPKDIRSWIADQKQGYNARRSDSFRVLT